MDLLELGLQAVVYCLMGDRCWETSDPFKEKQELLTAELSSVLTVSQSLCPVPPQSLSSFLLSFILSFLPLPLLLFVSSVYPSAEGMMPTGLVGEHLLFFFL